MTGISVAVSTQMSIEPLSIKIYKDDYKIGFDDKPYQWSAMHENIVEWKNGVLAAFKKLEQAVKQGDSVTLAQDVCDEQLVALAKWGRRAYTLFFDEDAREELSQQIRDIEQPGVLVAPTFHSNMLVFPWEVLYDGETYRSGDPNEFWGLRYVPARILKPGKAPSQLPRWQHQPSDMLFCLHHKLRYAHAEEWPEVRRLVKATDQDQCVLLSPLLDLTGGAQDASLNEALLAYLDAAKHNIVHFACHCKRGKEGDDALIISLITDELVQGGEQLIELATYTFTDVPGRFLHQPLVFLNACQSSGVSEETGWIFNLPDRFIKRDAAALVATACPVPDLFAAAFARKFYEYFLGRRLPIGEALRQTRWYFLREHRNPLGLAYGLYTPAHYQVAAQPMVAGGA